MSEKTTGAVQLAGSSRPCVGSVERSKASSAQQALLLLRQRLPGSNSDWKELLEITKGTRTHEGLLLILRESRARRATRTKPPL